MTPAGYREKTAAFEELKGLPVLKVVPKVGSQVAESAATHSARRAALARWQKVRTALALQGAAAPAPADEIRNERVHKAR